VGACNSYCASTGQTGRLSVVGSGGCPGYPYCNYVSDFNTCAIGAIVNNNECGTCAGTFTCTCSTEGSILSGQVTTQGELVVTGYTQLGTTSGAPPSTDCNSASYGRMKVDPAGNVLWICMASGWSPK
jgi:hypothetical protein